MRRLHRIAQQARLAADQDADRTRIHPSRWDTELARLRDPDRRRTELAAAHASDAERETRNAATQHRAAAERGRLRDAVAELRRRRALTTPERDLEHHARLETLDGQLPTEQAEQPALSTTPHSEPQPYDSGNDLGP
ncbi:hypothetical protein IU510_29740 [Nocardia cyriacigeorgica]|uniref:hypothetical protein n=1 Tax=Nocardia cyriacigeorgica TaxID=135487 RepID=UPI0018942F8F|nr:hypothetical protein [Nocardia cyriacigeorgica]MBF6102203.1 hypothetical protein [Nocardia cyriacigeorgica]MBF6347358.1 hypothetical protein [Nocardia cyriacigeorgica]